MTQVSDQVLHHYLNTLARKIVHNTPAFKNPPISIDKLVGETFDLLRYKESEYNQPINNDLLMQHDFIQQLMVTMSAIATLNNSEEIQKILHLIDKALNEFKKSNHYVQQLKSLASEQTDMLEALFSILDEMEELTKLDPSAREKMQDKIRKKLKKRLKGKALRKLEAMLNMYFIPQSLDTIKQAIEKLIIAVKNNLDKLNKKPDNSQTLTTDLYINLFGILSAYITGSHPIPMQSYIGNGLGFTDWNPYHGNANIDSINEISLVFGDSLGLEARTMRNYLRIPESTIAESFQLLRAEGFAPEPSQPTLTNFKPKHK